MHWWESEKQSLKQPNVCTRRNAEKNMWSLKQPNLCTWDNADENNTQPSQFAPFEFKLKLSTITHTDTQTDTHRQTEREKVWAAEIWKWSALTTTYQSTLHVTTECHATLALSTNLLPNTAVRSSV